MKGERDLREDIIESPYGGARSTVEIKGTGNEGGHCNTVIASAQIKVGKSVVASFTIEGKELAVALDNMEDGLHTVICTPDERRSFFKPNKPTHDGNHSGRTN